MEFQKLPNEVLQHIFGILDHESLLAVLEVCRQWNGLASTARFMHRIWFRMTMRDTKFMDQVNILRYSSRKYRHVVIDCGAGNTPRPVSGSVHQSQVEKLLPAIDNVETLVLSAVEDMTAADLLILLQNVSTLKVLCLLDTKVDHLLFKRSYYLQISYQLSWTEIFTKQSELTFQNVTDMTFTVSFPPNLKVEIFQQMFPNLKQLQVTVTDPSIVNLIDSYKSQLEKFSIFSISSNLLTLFCEIKFPKLSHVYLNTDISLQKMALTKCDHFFENLDHSKNLRYLKLIIFDASVISTICSNCTYLQVLEVRTTNIGFLKYVSNLRNLQKLSIRKLDVFLYRFEYSSNLEDMWRLEPIESLKIIEINGFFQNALKLLLNTVAPNLEMLVLENFELEKAFQILSASSTNIRHLKITFEGQSRKSPKLDFEYLRSKTNLVTYSLVNVLIDDDSIPKWIQMAPNLRTIIIENCETLSVDHLMIFNSCCPKLRQLQLKGCNGIVAQELNEIKKNLPHVVISNHVGQEQREQGIMNLFSK